MLNKKLTFVVSDTSTVTMKVYDAIGNLVATPVHEKKPAGLYCVNFDTTGLPNGTYSYEVFTGNSIEVKKIKLLV
ncbi:MAG: T9SS type A sorting domain-containing protein [Ignavibacterium sp.]|nr:MAG: T9SS type A sorting domain-containing protein [Ignavibacterium sp.]